MSSVLTALHLVALLATLGCAFPAQPPSMVPAGGTPVLLDAATVNVRAVGGSDTDLWGTSQISNAALNQAVSSALIGAGLLLPLADRPADYQLEVTLEEIEQPMWSVVTTVRVRTHWTLTPTGERTPIWSEPIAGRSTATVLDALVGTRRCRLATEGAAREAITEAMRRIALLVP